MPQSVYISAGLCECMIIYAAEIVTFPQEVNTTSVSPRSYAYYTVLCTCSPHPLRHPHTQSFKNKYVTAFHPVEMRFQTSGHAPYLSLMLVS